MKAKERLKFKVGDVVEITHDVPMGIKKGQRGVIVDALYVLDDKNPNTQYSWLVDDDDGDLVYGVEWFGLRISWTGLASEVKFCKGMKNTKLCEQCRYRFHCWTTRRR